jgi:hypothetical protein
MASTAPLLGSESIIQFSDYFTQEDPEYLLFELPKELETTLASKGELEIQEFKGDSYIVGEEHLYQIIKLQVSNLMLVSELKKEPVSHKDKVVVRSFQQSTLIPTPVRPFSQDLLLHLRLHAVDAASPNHQQPEMAVTYLKQKYLTNLKALTGVTDSLGAQIVDGFVVLLKDTFRGVLFRNIIDNARDKDLLKDKDSTLSLNNLEVPESERALVHVLFESSFEKVVTTGNSNTDQYKLKLQSMAELLLVAIRKDIQNSKDTNYEEVLSQLIQDINLVLPRAIVDSFGSQELQVAAEMAIRRFYLVTDNQDFNLPISAYSARNIKATQIDFEALPDTPLERLQAVSEFVTSFTRSELDVLLDNLFVLKTDYDNFLKKYFKRISRFISKSMLATYSKLFPSHILADLVKPNEIRKDTFEIKLYKVNKTWATK